MQQQSVQYIAGVATAIALGGLGSILMWVLPFFWMTTKFGEVVLPSITGKRHRTDVLSAVHVYIEKGLKMKWLAYICSFGAIAAFGIGNMVQSNSVAVFSEVSFGVNFRYCIGSIIGNSYNRRYQEIAQVTEKLVPFMAVFYILGGLFIIISNISHVGEAFGLIRKRIYRNCSSRRLRGLNNARCHDKVYAREYSQMRQVLVALRCLHAAATTDHPYVKDSGSI